MRVRDKQIATPDHAGGPIRAEGAKPAGAKLEATALGGIDVAKLAVLGP